jgi:hypothetical protein
VQLVGQLSFVNRSTLNESMLLDVDGKASIYKTEKGFAGIICVFLSSLEGAPIDINGLDQRKTELHHQCQPEGFEHIAHPDDTAQKSKFQLLVRQAKDKLKNKLDWVLVASMGDHHYEFELAVVAQDSHKRKAEATLPEPAPLQHRLLRSLPQCPRVPSLPLDSVSRRCRRFWEVLLLQIQLLQLRRAQSKREWICTTQPGFKCDCHSTSSCQKATARPFRLSGMAMVQL